MPYKPRRETALRTKIRVRLLAVGAKAVITHGGRYSGRRGTPDILGCYKGWSFAIEVKDPNGDEPTEHQMQQLREWAAAGSFAYVADSIGVIAVLMARISSGRGSPGIVEDLRKENAPLV